MVHLGWSTPNVAFLLPRGPGAPQSRVPNFFLIAARILISLKSFCIKYLKSHFPMQNEAKTCSKISSGSSLQ